MTRGKLQIGLFLWYRVHRQFRNRSAGRRESGAFLLGRRSKSGNAKVRTFLCFDDLDPDCLSRGYVDFHSGGYAQLWQQCRRMGFEVLADVHTHPGKDSSQSEIDRLHPMIGEAGHMAIIVPCYAANSPFAARINVRV